MRTLLASDLHDDLRKLDWVLAEAPDVDLLVAAGDLGRHLAVQQRASARGGPAHVFLDLDRGAARCTSLAGSGEISIGTAGATAGQ